MKEKLDLKKNITIVENIYNFDCIISELDEKVKNYEIKENLPELEDSVGKVKENINNGEYDISKIIAKYFKNKNGKYVVFCKNDAEMEQITKDCLELFGKVNETIEISALRKKISKEIKNELVKNFNESNDNKKLKLLFVNSISKNMYDIKDADGAIIIDMPTTRCQKQDKIIYKAISCCKNDGIIINNSNNLYLVARYKGEENNIRNFVKGNVTFIDEKSIIDVENARRKSFTQGISDEAKLRIIKEYKNEIGQVIKANTIYKGYRLGTWQNNLRQAYMNGTLKMEDDLLMQYEEEGILGTRKRAIQTSDKEKFEILKDYREKHPDTHIVFGTVDENNVPIGKYRTYLQVSVNAKKSDLSKEQIEYLRENDLLYYAKEEVEEFAKKFNISRRTANVITTKYPTIEEFIKLYKQGSADIKTLKLNKRGLIVSKKELPQGKKQCYIELLEAVFGKNVLENNSKFASEENINKAISKLTKKEQNILLKKFGINTEKKTEKELLEELGCHRAYIYQVQNRALNKLSKNISIYDIDSLNRLKTSFTEEFEKVSKMTEKQWKNYNMNLDIKYLNFTKTLTKNLKEAGYNTLRDLGIAEEEELSKVPSVGDKKLEMIIDLVEERKGVKKANKIKSIKKLLNNIDSKITAYDNAYKYYMENENIFNQDETIPASIVKKSSLTKKKEEKAKKQNKLAKINDQIVEQDEKTEKLENILGVNKDKKIGE